MQFSEFKEFVLKSIKDHPDKKDQITDMYWLAIEEINDGGDPTHECELGWQAIQDIINENE